MDDELIATGRHRLKPETTSFVYERRRPNDIVLRLEYNTGLGHWPPLLVDNVPFHRIVNLEREVYDSVFLGFESKSLMRFGM